MHTTLLPLRFVSFRRQAGVDLSSLVPHRRCPSWPNGSSNAVDEHGVRQLGKGSSGRRPLPPRKKTPAAKSSLAEALARFFCFLSFLFLSSPSPPSFLPPSSLPPPFFKSGQHGRCPVLPPSEQRTRHRPRPSFSSSSFFSLPDTHSGGSGLGQLPYERVICRLSSKERKKLSRSRGHEIFSFSPRFFSLFPLNPCRT